MKDHDLRYFENYAPGATCECGGVSIDAARIVSFAKRFDPQPFHVDPGAAADGLFGGLIASGWHRRPNHAAARRQFSLGGAVADEIHWPIRCDRMTRSVFG